MSVYSTSKLQKMVDAGVSFLNGKVPNWRTRINVEELNMINGRNCILGQLWKSLNPGIVSGCPYLDMVEQWNLHHKDSVSKGFILESTSFSSYDELTKIWREAVVNPKPSNSYFSELIVNAREEEEKLSEEIQSLKAQIKNLKQRRKDVRQAIKVLS